MTKILQFFIMLTFVLGSINCSPQDNTQTNSNYPPPKTLLGIAITHSENEEFDDAFAEVQKIGIEFTSLPINWDDIEKSPGKFDPELNYLKIANAFYPANNIKIALELNPIDTVKTRIPSDLYDKNFDDPQVIDRFKSFIDWSFAQIPNLDLVSLSIGNEVDVYLGNDAEKWKQYQKFFEEVSSYAKKLTPDLKIGTKITYNGLTEGTAHYAKSMNSATDVILTTYYHLKSDFTVKSPKTVSDSFEKVTKLFPSKEIYFLEIGMPSGRLCNSSEEKQAEFIRETFKSWANYSEQIKLLNFTWLTDISKESTDKFTVYYGVSIESFREFLATLGMRTNSGKAKLALLQLKEENKKRKNGKIE